MLLFDYEQIKLAGGELLAAGNDIKTERTGWERRRKCHFTIDSGELSCNEKQCQNNNVDSSGSVYILLQRFIFMVFQADA